MDIRMITAGAAFAAAMLAGGPGVAGETKANQVKVGSARVAVDHEALSTEAGARDLLARMDAAARKACGGDARRHSSWKSTPDLARRAFETCRQEAVARAVAELGSPRLAAAHAAGPREGLAR